MNNIITQLKKAYETINAHVIGYIRRKEIHSFINKSKTHYIIESGFNESNNIQLKVFFNNNKTKLFPFEYCKYKEKYVIFFPKNKIENKLYRVNFILDDQVIINPHFHCEELDGFFVNVLNFEEFQQEELHREIEFKRQIKYYLCYLQRKNISLLKEEEVDEEEEDDSGIKYKFGVSNHLSRRKLNSTTSSVSTMCNSIEFQSSKGLPCVTGHKLTRPKSILKMLRRQSSNNIKKVRFGKVQFSY